MLAGLAIAVFLGAATLGRDAKRPAQEIISEFNKVKYPGFISNISMEDYGKLVAPAAQRQCDLALELFESHPDHPQVPRLMGSRWTLTVNSLHFPRRTIRETEKFLADGPARLRGVAATRRAYAGLADPETSVAERFRYVREALKLAPDDKHWGPNLLYRLAFENSAKPVKQRQLYELSVKRFGKKSARGMREYVKLLDLIGQRMELSFDDLMTGKPAAIRKGRPTIVFVWGPTARAITDIQALKRAQGVDVLCVHFGGPSKEGVRKAAAAQGIVWPVYFDEREFDEQWVWKLGVRYGRTFFLLDGEGKITAMTHRAAPLLARLRKQASVSK